MSQLIQNCASFGLFLTLGAYLLGVALNKRFKSPLTNPLLLSLVIIIPVLLLCGEKDGAGSAKSYNRRWAKQDGHPLIWLKGAGHNSNTDAPEEVNRRIEAFLADLG